MAKLDIFTKKFQIWSLDSGQILVYDIMGHIIWDISFVLGPIDSMAHISKIALAFMKNFTHAIRIVKRNILKINIRAISA